MKQYNKLFAILFAVLGVTTLQAQTDVTSTYMTNAGLTSLDGWTRTDYTDYKTDGDVPVIEFYHSWSWNAGAAIGNSKEFYFKQSVTLPAGEYRLAVNAFYREGNGNGTNTKAYIFAGEQQKYIVGLSAGALDSYSGGNDLYKAANAFSKGAFSNEFDFTVEQQTTLEIGFKGYIDTYCSWCILGPVKLYQYSMADFNAELNAARTKLQGLTGLNTAMANKVSALLSETANVAQTKAAILEATAKANTLYNEAVAMQPAIQEANEAIAVCESMLNNSTADDKTTFSNAISTAKTTLANATDAATVVSILSPLNEAKNAYCLVAAPAEGYPFDMTHLVVNPKFDEGTTGWSSNTGAPNNGIATNQGGAITGNYFENWKEGSYTGEIYQELTGLPKGKYKLTAAAFRDQLIADASDGDAVYVFANDVETLVNSATPAFYSVEVSTTTGSLRFGVKSKVAKYRWMGIDNVSLQFIEALDLSEFIAAYNTALEAAKAARDNAEYANITGIERTELLSAIADTPEEEQESLANATIALQSATATFIASKADYDLLVAEKVVAENLGMNETKIAEIINGKTGLAALYDLKEEEYVYVMESFNYPVALSNDWNSAGEHTRAADVKGEHWSDDKEYTYKNQFDGWGDPKEGYPANEWSIDFDQSVTLPAGEYVFKVAGRKSVDATLELVVTMGETVLGTVNDFPSSNEALGINKAGATSFDANDPAGFAKEGKGYGWQWRYVRFDLDEEATVKVAVHAETNMIYNWVSFGDYTLQMTEETYLEANKGGLDAPTAAANALVDTKPMGAAENNALKAALAMTYTTGAQLLAKIEALNTAVANAESWVTAYNNAKAPLVAALDRFEAEYNDAQNGALHHMNVNRWATAISMAQAAAVAKDVTDSYEGFAAATEELVAALDAATTSVNEYSALDAAIETASSLYLGANWGEDPFQMPISKKDALNTENAQTIYDEATADGEGVTSVTEALNNGVNTPLNAPEEGQRFYIKVATDGHGKYGNAVLATLGNTGGNNPTGYGLNANNAVKPHLNQAFIFTQVDNNLYNISIERAEGTVYLTYGSLNGSAAGWNKQQIQATTDAEKKGEFKLVSTNKKNVLKIYNTVDNNYLDCQDGGSIYTDTGIEKEEFTFELATETEVTLTFSSVGWATLILPFDAELPEGVKAYSCTAANTEENALTLEEVEDGIIKANTPYLMNSYGTEFTFSGYGLADRDSYTVGLFTGTYVDYTTTANSNTYVLQKRKGEDEAAFYLVGGDTQPIVKPNRCYMTYDADEAAAPAMFSFGRGEGTTEIDNMESTANSQQPIVIYDLLGRKVNTMEKGKVYIVNGKKVVIK